MSGSAVLRSFGGGGLGRVGIPSTVVQRNGSSSIIFGAQAPLGISSVWLTVPTITFPSSTVIQYYDISQWWILPQGATYVGLVLAPVSNTLPPAVTLDSANKRFVCAANAGSVTVTGIVLDLTYSTGVASGGNFATRIVDPGVIWYHSFDTVSEVNAFKWAGTINLAEHDPTGGVDGGGALRLYAAAGRDSVGWLRPWSPLTGASNGRGVDDPGGSGAYGHLTPLGGWTNINSGWSRGWYCHPSYAASMPGGADGSELWLQFRMKIGASRFTTQNYADSPSGPGTGGKTVYIADNIYNLDIGSAQEIVQCNNYSYGPYGWWSCQTQFGTGIQGPGGAIQYGSNWPLCGTNSDPGGPTGCWAWVGDTWYTFMYHLRPGRAGVAETLMDVKVAAQGQTAWTQLFYYDQLSWVYKANVPQAWNQTTMSNYFNGCLVVVPWYSWYDQIIFSKAPIALPVD